MSDFQTGTISTFTGGDAEVIIDTAIRTAEPTELADDQAYAFVVPQGARVEVVDVDREERLDHPRRKKGTVQLVQTDSLIAYVGDHDVKDGRTRLYADVRGQRVVAVLNGPNTEPGWGDHKAILTLTTTPEWKRWIQRDGLIGEQVEFAEHIEDCLDDIVEPPGADILELAQTFQATTAAEFRTGARLQDGRRQLTYVEEINASAGTGGEIEVPSDFLISISPIEGSDPVTIKARLRYRVGGGKLRIGYILHRPDVVLREAFDSVVANIEAGTGIAAYHGTPAA